MNEIKIMTELKGEKGFARLISYKKEANKSFIIME